MHLSHLRDKILQIHTHHRTQAKIDLLQREERGERESEGFNATREGARRDEEN